MKLNVYFVQYHIGDMTYEDYVAAQSVEAAMNYVRAKFNHEVIFDQILREGVNVEVAE